MEHRQALRHSALSGSSPALHHNYTVGVETNDGEESGKKATVQISGHWPQLNYVPLHVVH